jgi:hypothetical protein
VSQLWKGSFGKELIDGFAPWWLDSKEKKQLIDEINKSATFKGLITKVNSSFFPFINTETRWKRFRQGLDKEGWITIPKRKPSPSLSEYQKPTGRYIRLVPLKRQLHIRRSENGSYFRQFDFKKFEVSVLSIEPPGYDTIAIEVNRTNWPADFTLSLGHELAHAVLYFERHKKSSRTRKKSPLRGLREFLTDEIKVREIEEKIAKEIKHPRTMMKKKGMLGVRGKIELINSGVMRPDVERSFPSGEPYRTYVESYYLDYLDSKVKHDLSNEDKTMIKTEIDKLLDKEEELDGKTASVLDLLVRKIQTREDYGWALSEIMSEVFRGEKSKNIHFEYATNYLVRRIVGERWRRFRERHSGSEKYFSELEVIAKEHEKFFLAPEGLKYTDPIIRDLTEPIP